MKKTTLKVQICFAICSIFMFSTAFSQGMMYEIPFQEQVQKSQQIVEGKVISKKSFWDINQHNIYTVNTIEIYKVFKGLTIETLNVITSGGNVGLDMETVEPSLQLSIGDIGVFMLNDNGISLLGDNTSGPKFNTYADSQGFYKYDIFNGSATNPFNKNLDVLETLYPELERLTDVSHTVVDAFNFLELNNRNSGGINIVSFTPTTVAAGTGITITISGAGFGASPGSVGFSDANDGGSTYYNGLATQIVSWNDTQIEVVVPDRAGSGTIRVVNSSSDTGISGQTLTVSYAELNAEYDPGTGEEAYETQHIDRDGSGGYVWQMFTGFDANTAAKDAFIRALDTWRCETEINWTIGTVTTTDVVANDNINIIRFDNGTELPSGVLGRCTSRWSGCIVGGTDIYWYVEELDIAFNDSTNWNYSTSAPTFSQYDFESVAVHELGHGHQLGHVIDSGAIMHYAISNGSFNRTLSTNDIAGGNDVQSRSTSITVCGESLVDAFDCATLNVEAFELADQLSIYPSPAHSVLNISNGSNYTLDMYAIYDINGRIIKTKKLNNTIANIIQINALSNGVYFIKIKAQGTELTKKFIKQ